jgi:hypothetical protein
LSPASLPLADVPWTAAIGIAIISGILGPLTVDWFKGRRSSRLDRSNKDQLHSMLTGEKFRIRSLETLARASGTSDEECRRLLREIGARGVTLKSGKEGWKLLDQSARS